MKKAGIFAAVIAAVLLFMQFYNYRLAGYTEDGMFVIDGVQAAHILKNGVEEAQSGDMVLKEYEAGTPLYRRGDKRFIGQDYEALSLSYPVYVNEGAYLYHYSDQMELVASDFTRLNTYDGLYVVDGRSYNRDRQQADPDEFLFVETPDGLFFNVQEMRIQSGGQEQILPINSLMNLEQDLVSWYQMERGGVYRLKEYQDLMQAQVTIGSVTMDYGKLVSLLKGEEASITVIEPEIPLSSLEKPEPETLPENPQGLESESEAAEDLETSDSQETAESQEAADRQETAGRPGETEKPEQTEQSAALGGQGEVPASQSASQPEALPLHPPIPGDRDGWEFPSGNDITGDEDGDGGQDEGDHGDGDQGEGGHGDGDQGDGGHGDGGQGGGGQGEGGQGEGDQGGGGQGGGQGEGGQPQFSIPKASVKNFDFSVYSATAELTIEDPSLSIIKGVRLVFYKEGEARASYRKMYYGQGPITIQPLEPDTRYEVEGYFDYQHPVYGKTREFFQEKTYCGKTLPITALEKLAVEHQADEENLLPHAIQIKDFSVKDASGAASSSETTSGISAVNYISSVQMSFEKKGVPDWNSLETVLSTTLTSRLKRGEEVVWRTADVLDSASRYGYQIDFYDRYGNKLPVSEKEGSGARGEARTCKQAPVAKVTLDRTSTVDKMRVKVSVSNPDKAGYSETPYLYVTYADEPDTPIPFRLAGEDEDRRRYELKDKKETELTFTSFLPSTVYTVWVRGSYDLEDGKTYERELMGQLAVTTNPLTSLGTVNFTYEMGDFTWNSGRISVRMRNQVQDSLYPFVSRLTFALKKEGEEAPCFTYIFDREALEKKMLKPGEEWVIYDPAPSAQIPTYEPQIRITLPKDASGERSVWDTILTTGDLEVVFPENGLASATGYEAAMRAYAVRGDSQGEVTEDVTGRYYKTNCRTLRKPSEVKYDMSFINGTSATFYKLRVEDPDGAVAGGNLILRLRNASNGALLEVRTTTVEELAQTASTAFHGLTENTQYLLQVVASEYNEGYTNTTKVLQKLLGEISFRSVNTLYGSMEMDSMDNGYDAQKPEDGYGIDSRNLFDLNRATVGYITANAGGIGIQGNNNYMVSDYIPVEQGKTYILGGGMYAYISTYNSDKKYLRTAATTQGNTFFYWRPGADTSYVRVSAMYKNGPSAFMSEMLFDEVDSEANLIRQPGVEITEGKGWEHDGKLVNTGKNYASTNLIPVKPGEVLFRKDASNAVGTWLNNRIAWFDKDKKVISTTTVNAVMGVAAAPDNAAYVALNLGADYKDKLYLARRPANHYGSNLMAADSGLTWHKGMYISETNGYTKQSVQDNKYCDYVPVTGSAIYFMQNLTGIQMVDAEKNYLGYMAISGDTYIQMPQEAAYIRANSNAKTQIFRLAAPARNTASVNLGFRVTLSDLDSSLGENPVFTLEYKKTDSDGQVTEWQEEYEADPQTRRFDEIVYIENGEPGCQYEVTQTVTLGGNRIVLSTLVMSTASKVRVIQSEAALRAARYAPMDDYVVTEDIEVTSTSSVIQYFYGHMDFQGHTLTLVDRSTLIEFLRAGAVLENLVMDYQRTPEAGRLNSLGMLCKYVQGLMQNVVLKITIDNQQDNIAFGGLAYQVGTTGIIDGFAIQLNGSLYARRDFGLAAYQNYGQIRNGYMVSGENSVITLNTDAIPEGELAAAWNYRSAMVGINYEGGIVENLYSVATVDSPPHPKGAGVSYHALGVGQVYGGTVRNMFSVGMLLKNGLPTTEGPTVASRNSANSTRNISYVATQTFEDKNYYGNLINNGVLATSLWDPVWMDTAVNGGGRFQTGMAADGLYPQITMPSCMDGAQPVTPLPAREAHSVKLLSNQVLEQNEEDALVRFYFDNRNRLQIKDLKIAVMNISSGTDPIRQYEVAADTQVVSQGVGDDGVYYADVKVTNPTRFRSQYFVDCFTVGLAGSSASDLKVEENSREKQEVGLEFYKPITNFEEWRDMRKNLDLYGNYRLKAEEFDFSGISAEDMTKSYVISTFRGNLTGQWTDEAGNSRTTVLKNMNVDSRLIETLHGSVSHLKVENLTLNERGHTGYWVGLFGNVNAGYLDHIEVTNAQAQGACYVGILASQMDSSARMTNCSVSDSSLKSLVKGSEMLRMGGLVGHGGNGRIQNCFVRNIQIDNRDTFDNVGVGGLAGYSASLVIDNCYATGIIDTEYRNVGGLIGEVQGATRLRSCYAKVDVDSYGDYIGGLIGYVASGLDNFRGNLSLGDLFVHSSSMERINRLIGYPSEGQRRAENYGFESQMFNNKVDPSDPGDADGVLTGTQLGNRDTWLRELGWSTSDYALSWELDGKSQSVADGYLPLLYSTEGELLPGQIPVPYGQGQMKLEAEEFTVNNNAGAMSQDWFGYQAIQTALDLRMKLTYDKERYQVASENGVPKIEIKGMKMNHLVTTADGIQKEGYQVQPYEGENAERWWFPFVETEMGGDLYRLTATLESREDPELKVTLSAMVAPPAERGTYSIYNAEDWQKLMAQYGQSYANFILMDDVDFGSIPKEELITDVKINRLTSAGEAKTIKNAQVEVTGVSGGLIATCLSEITNVNFEDCTVTVTAGTEKTLYHNRVGLIATNMGHIQNVKFKGITVKSGYGAYTGCVGYSLGYMKDITAEDLTVHGDQYAGGVAGYSASALERITAKGTLKDAGDGTYDSTYTVEGRLNSGGVLGTGSLTNQCQIKGLKVVGTNEHARATDHGIQSIGGAIGNGSFTAPSVTVDDKMANSSKVADCYVTVRDTHTADTSHYYLGGAVGNGNPSYLQVENVKVEFADPKASEKVNMYYAGGAAGNGSVQRSVIRSVTPDEKNDYTIPETTVTSQYYAGGAVGRGSVSDYTVVDSIEVHAKVKYAGGLAGYHEGSWVSNNLADRVTVTAPEASGGVTGRIGTGYIYANLVSRCSIKADGACAGGIGGQAKDITIAGHIYQNGVVKTEISAGTAADSQDSYAGGLAGDLQEPSKVYENYVRQTEITGSGDKVGGLFGNTAGGQYYGNYIDHESSVAGRNQVGGMIGHLKGRKKGEDKTNPTYLDMKLYESYSAVKVTGDDYVGGLIGAYETGPLNANDYEAGFLIPNPDNFYGVVMMGHVKRSGSSSGAGDSGSHADLFLNMLPDPDGKLHDWSGKSLRIFEEATLNGTKASDASFGFKKLEDYKTVSLGGQIPDASANGETLQSTLLVTREDLRDKRMYTVGYELGGMKWAVGWRYLPLGRLDDTRDSNPHAYSPMISETTIIPSKGMNNDTQVVIPGDGSEKVYDATSLLGDLESDPENVPVVRLPDGASEYAWFRFDSAGRANEVNLDITAQELPLAGRGYYLGRAKVNGTYYYTPFIKIDSLHSYMPQLNSGTGWRRGAQEGLPKSILVDGEPLWKWQRAGQDGYQEATIRNMGFQSDNLFYGGTVIPTGPSGSRESLSLQGDIPVTVYPSGPDTINVELGADYAALTSLTVSWDGQIRFSGRPVKRVYTLDYDYRSPVEITVKACASAGETDQSKGAAEADEPGQTGSGAEGSRTAAIDSSAEVSRTAAIDSGAEGSRTAAIDSSAEGSGTAAIDSSAEVSRTVTIDSSALRRTVMVYGSEYYYTCGGKLMDSSGVAVDDEIIHLYDGQALSMDGRIYDLTGGASERSFAGQSRAAAVLADQPKEPVPFWEDGELRAFGEFTEVATEEGSMVQEQQLVRKDGELYALTGGQSLKGMVLDSYNGETYASFLNEKGRLKDAADALHTPENFNRSGIAHMSSSLNADIPVVLVRYASGIAKGFDYTTGEELPIENAFSDLSILDFAGDFLGQFTGAAGDGSLEFADLKELEGQLILSPIPEGLTGGSNRLDKTEVPEGETQMADPETDGSSQGGGSNEASGESSDGASGESSNEDSGESSNEDSGDASNEDSGESEGGSQDQGGSESQDQDGGGAESESQGGSSNEDSSESSNEDSSGASNGGSGESEGGSQNQGGSEDAGSQSGGDKASDREAGSVSADSADGEPNSGSAEDSLSSALSLNGNEAGDGAAGQPGVTADGKADQSGITADGKAEDSKAEHSAAENSDGAGNGTEAEAGSGTEAEAGNSTEAEAGNSTEAEAGNSTEAEAGSAAETDGSAADGKTPGNGTLTDDSEPGGGTSKPGPESGVSKNPASPTARSAAYTYAFNTKDGSSRLYSTQDLLTKKGSDLLDEEEKLELLKASGVVTEDYIVAPAADESQSRTGTLIFAITAAAALGLTGLLIRRKRKYD